MNLSAFGGNIEEHWGEGEKAWTVEVWGHYSWLFIGIGSVWQPASDLHRGQSKWRLSWFLAVGQAAAAAAVITLAWQQVLAAAARKGRKENQRILLIVLPPKSWHTFHQNVTGKHFRCRREKVVKATRETPPLVPDIQVPRQTRDRKSLPCPKVTIWH